MLKHTLKYTFTHFGDERVWVCVRGYDKEGGGGVRG